MNQHNLFSFLVVLWLWSPIFCYSPFGCGALGIRKTKFNEAFPSHGQPFCLARSKTEFNPYRVVSNITAIVYEEVPESSVLLSVDLGLRSGLAFYDSKGILLSFSYLRFESILTLEDSVCKLLAESSILHDITHFVLEGDAVYGAIWSTAIQNYSIERKKAVEVMYVSPAEWRERMLLKKERKSGKDAKYAAREISRQIMWKSGEIHCHYFFCKYLKRI